MQDQKVSSAGPAGLEQTGAEGKSLAQTTQGVAFP